MEILKRGSKGDLVVRWQAFLVGGRGPDDVAAFELRVDGDFGPVTEAATKEWQEQQGLDADGIVGRLTWVAAQADGFSFEAWPPRPLDAQPLLGNAAREELFGAFNPRHTPTRTNPEAITIDEGWKHENIVRMPIPALERWKPDGIWLHRLAAPQIEAWFAAISAKRLAGRILSFDGAYVARYVRGRVGLLSNHAFGSAVDLNASMNGFGAKPARFGQRGSVRELASFCYDFGLWWGGWFSYLDGMHFEVARLLTPEELAAAKTTHGLA